MIEFGEKKRVLVIFGTRPEAIKMLPIARELRKCEALQPIILSTGQHKELVDQVLLDFEESVDINLGLMVPGQSLPRLTASLIEGVNGGVKTGHGAEQKLATMAAA